MTPTIGDLVRGLKDMAWPIKPIAIEPTAPDLTLLFKAQARLANFSEAVIKGVVGFYREWAPELNMEQLHALAFFFDEQFEQGIRVGEGARRQQEGE